MGIFFQLVFGRKHACFGIKITVSVALRPVWAFYSPASSPQLFIAELLTAEIQK